jgi:hypothetical protein
MSATATEQAAPRPVYATRDGREVLVGTAWATSDAEAVCIMQAQVARVQAISGALAAIYDDERLMLVYSGWRVERPEYDYKADCDECGREDVPCFEVDGGGVRCRECVDQ